jgi:hypothetical protein
VQGRDRHAEIPRGLAQREQRTGEPPVVRRERGSGILGPDGDGIDGNGASGTPGTIIRARSEHLYEERVTLRQTTSIDAALKLAEQEAQTYCADETTWYVGLAQAFALFDKRR